MKVIITEENLELREIIKSKLLESGKYEIMGLAHDLFTLRSLLQSDKPDFLIIDVESLGLDGIEFLRKFIHQENIAVLAITPQTQKGKYSALQLLELGVLDFVVKPPTDIKKGIELMLQDLLFKLKSVPKANIDNFKVEKYFSSSAKTNAMIKDNSILRNKIIAVGSSTGSIPLLKRFLMMLPQEIPGMVVITDLPSGFTKTFADRLNELSKVKIWEAVNQDIVKPGTVMIAPGDMHTKVCRIGNKFQVIVENGEKVNNQRPSIDVLMHSLAEQAPKNTIGILLSGNTEDGIHGFLEAKRAGAKNIILDKATVVFDSLVIGAYELRSMDYIVKPDKLISTILELVGN